MMQPRVAQCPTSLGWLSDTTNTDTCPQGAAEVTSTAACQAAAAQLGKTYSSSPRSSSNYPKGCFSSGASVYYNSGTSGSTASASYGKICGPAWLSDTKNSNTCPQGQAEVTSTAACQVSQKRVDIFWWEFVLDFVRLTTHTC